MPFYVHHDPKSSGNLGIRKTFVENFHGNIHEYPCHKLQRRIP